MLRILSLHSLCVNKYIIFLGCGNISYIIKNKGVMKMIGERLSEIRKDHGDTQMVLAKKLKVSLPTVRAWEQGRSSPSHETLVTICRLYRVSADYLLGLSDTDPAYMHYHHQAHLTAAEQAELQRFERYLFWRRQHAD